MAILSLTKHHGLGNDFLVYLDLRELVPSTADLAVVLCDRHRGIGADGLVRVGPARDGAHVSMELRNADGSPAETSGNGLRCVGQAVVDAGVVPGPEVMVATAAGVRRVEVRASGQLGAVDVSVDMGAISVSDPGETPRPCTEEDVKAALRVRVGNPHLVLLVADADAVDVAHAGPIIEASEPGGINVEFVAQGSTEDELRIRTWERGAGQTQACGTGSCAAAAAAHVWGLVGDDVLVHNPGGTLGVHLGPDNVVLTGPAQRVATVTVDLAAVLANPASRASP